MIDADLLHKFDSIEDLPVSEEMLGAYLEGNLDDAEVSEIESMLQNSSNLTDIYENIIQTSAANSLSSAYDTFIYNEEVNIFDTTSENGFDRHELDSENIFSQDLTLNEFESEIFGSNPVYPEDNSFDSYGRDFNNLDIDI